mgnify:CR=1 FL=1
MTDPMPTGQVAAPPGGRLLALAKRGAEPQAETLIAIDERRLARVVYNHLTTDHHARTRKADNPTPAAA